MATSSSASSAAASSADPTTRVPQLASASSTAGLAYSLWRPQMQTFLMRQGVEDRDYTEEQSRWRVLVTAVQTDARAAERAAIEALIGAEPAPTESKTAGTMPSAVSSSSVKQGQPTSEAAAAKKTVAAMISRSQKAFGFLYAALPADLRLLVADVPQGYAYGVWSFLEKKFRNTEADNVAALWKQFVTLAQSLDETFDEYKARVDSVVELLKHAKASLDESLYTTILMWNLQPRYATAVLTLKTGDRLKDPAKIDWPAIAEYMAQYERSQESLGETGEGERTFALRSRQYPPQSSLSSSSSNPGGASRRDWTKDAVCFNCQQTGHIMKECPEPRKERRRYDGRKSRGGKGASGPQSASSKKKKSWALAAASAGVSSGGSESDSEPQMKGARMAREVNRFAALAEDDDDKAPPVAFANVNRSYAALLLNTTSATSAAATSGDKAAAATKEKKRSTVPAVTAERALGTVVPVVRQAKTLRPLDDLLKTTAKAVDSAATVSTSCRRENLEGVQRCKPVLIKMADGTVLSAMYKGTLTLRLPIVHDKAGRYVTTKIPDVYYHERFDANLLSWGLMRKNGWEMHSTKSGTHLVTPGGKMVKASTRGELTILEDFSEERVYKLGAVVCMSAKDMVAHHRRLGHISWTRLLEMSKAGATAGIGDIRGMSATELAKAEEAVKECAHCAQAKAHRKAVGHGGLDKGAEAGAVLHVDTAPVMTRDPTSGQKGMRPVLSVKDSFTEFWWTTVCLRMADVQQAVIDVLEHSHTLTGRYPRLLIGDLGSEFENQTVKGFCKKRGIQWQPSPARAKELNGLSEKNIDTLKNHTRAMLFAAGAEESLYWRFALTHFVFAWNRTHIGRRTGTTPYQAMTGREPSVLNLAEFGCDAYVHQHRSRRDETFSRKAEPAVYLGHDGRQNCPQALLLRSGKIVLSKDVHFREGSFKHLRALTKGREADVPAYEDTGADDPEETAFDAAAAEVIEESEADEMEAASATRYVLRSITDTRVQNGVKQYLVKWSGYSGATWEPASLIKEDAPKAVQEYESLLADRATARSSVMTRSQARAVATSSSSSSPTVVSDSDAEDDESSVSVAATYAARRL
jgi:hypothetical protein